MARKPQSKSALSDAERHVRFVETAREVGASEDPKVFDAAFERVIEKIITKSPTPKPDYEP